MAGNSDNLLVLDEISQADAKEAGNIVYMLANAIRQAADDQEHHGSAHSVWRIMFLSTGEVTLAQRMTDAGRRTMTGMEVRLVEHPRRRGRRSRRLRDLA